MKFLADENIPLKVVKKLREEGFDIISVTELSPGISDEESAEMSQNENRVLITFDKDFGRILFIEGLKVPGLILLRFPPKNIEYIYSRLKKVFESDVEFYGKVVSVHEDKMRVSKL